MGAGMEDKVIKQISLLRKTNLEDLQAWQIN